MKNEVGGEKERPGQYIDSESPFCRNCTRDDCPTNGDGCKAWEAYFIANWKGSLPYEFAWIALEWRFLEE